MRMAIALLVALVAVLPVFAGDWKQEGQDGRGKWVREHKADGAWIEAYDDGNCKIERKREKDGKYEEKVDCKQTPVSGRFYLPRR
jgi:hypothetical protein